MTSGRDQEMHIPSDTNKISENCFGIVGKLVKQQSSLIEESKERTMIKESVANKQKFPMLRASF